MTDYPIFRETRETRRELASFLIFIITAKVFLAARNGIAQGKVKWLDSQKGFGFIEPEDGTQDVFVHITAVQNSGMDGLSDNQPICFDVENGQNGKTSAVNLKSL